MFHAIRHPWSDDPSGKADALKKTSLLLLGFQSKHVFSSRLKKIEEILHVHVTVEFFG